MGFWDDVGKGVVDVAKAAKEAADDTAKGIQEEESNRQRKIELNEPKLQSLRLK